eukprot:gnl/Trimastix_PCT/2030.p1 GENE.gnl/Trimastix_PCT/2030~~gnl/Trimastix_PCT/2030.p1  ORF type:complete len:217 (-),score=58.94 gnl/Trimastix_PCT/2030:41-643(-)
MAELRKPEILKMLALSRDLPPEKRRAILQINLRQLEGNLSTDQVYDAAQNIDIDPLTLAKVFTGNDFILRYAIANQKRDEALEEVLAGVPSMSAEICRDFVAAVSQRYDALRFASFDTPLRFPSLRNFRWRVDVSLSTGRLSRNIRPCVLMEFALTDGTTRLFEMDIQRFHKFRYSVAAMLQEMILIDQIAGLKRQVREA